MEKTWREGSIRFLLPVTAIGIAVLCQLAVARLLPNTHSFPYAFFYIIGIFAVAWLGGYVSATLACLLAIIIVPYATHRPNQPPKNVDPTTTAFVFGTALLISRVSASQRREQAILRRANDELETRVQDRTQALERAVGNLTNEIVERRRAEDAVRTSERLLESVTDNSPAVIYIKDREGRYLLINKRYEELFHVRTGEMVGKTDHDLFPKGNADAYRAVDLRVMTSGAAVEVEEVAPLDDGPHDFLSIKYPLRNDSGEVYAMCGISSDITERKRSVQALRESRERTLAIVETALDALITMDHEGRIVEFNPAAEHTFGYARSAVIGKLLADALIPPRLRDQHRHGLAHYLATGDGPVLGKRTELFGLRANGMEIPLELSIARMPGGGPPMFTAFVRDITERKQAEAGAALLAGIIASTDDAIYSKTHDGTVTSWNAGAQRIFGYSADEIVGRPIDILIPADLDGEEEDILARVRRGERLDNYETVRVRRDGRRIDISLTVSPVRDAAGEIVGVSKIARDITEKKRAGQRVQEQLGRLHLLDQITRAIGERHDLRSVFQVVIRTLEDSLPIDFGCVCLYDPDAKTLTVTSVGVRSEALAMEMAMREHAEIAADRNGLSRCVLGHLVYEPDLSQSDEPFHQRLRRGGLNSLVAAPLVTESSVFGVLVAARRHSNGFSSSDCEFLRQLSEHVALAARQAQIHAALQQAYDDLRRSQETAMERDRLRALGQMASGIAHDINNALSPVALYTDVLLERETNLSMRTREYLEISRRAVADVTHTVARMKEFYREREPQLELTPVDLNGLVRQVLDLTKARWSDMPQQGGIVIRLSMELEPDLPAIAGIESEIREALTNLVFNAVDAMPDGGTLTLRTQSTQGAGPGFPGHIRVDVEDSGIGMDEETRRRCLEPFFTTKGERGTGLGLGMVYGVAQRQNAELVIESAVGKGTTAGLIFTATESAAQPAPVASAPPAVPRLRILIVDDDPLILRLLRNALEGDGHDITSANGGQEGIDMAQAAAASDTPFAVVITDLGMPYIDGRKVASAVKLASRDTAVILLTGWGQRLVAEQDIPADVDCVLDKPPKLRELREALTTIKPRQPKIAAL